jgi:5'-methylthioadenosine/S-adenosylhomocysteine nucleosidase
MAEAAGSESMKTLVVTPLQEELDFISRSCTQRGFDAEHATIGRLPVVRFPSLGITLARGGLGKAQFAAQTQHLLDTDSDWQVVVCAGAAGGLSDTLSVGDVVVATTTIEHDFKNHFGPRRYPTFEGAPDKITDLSRISRQMVSFKVHFGTVASGDEDVVDPKRRQVLQETMGALAVAWEGAGGARACAFSKMPFIEIRGITDAANHTAASQFETNLELAMNNIAVLMTTWLTQA